MTRTGLAVLLLLTVALIPADLGAQGQRKPAPKPAEAGTPVVPDPPVPVESMALPADYVIGTDDLLGIVFWRDKEMSGDVVVRPDGMITLPLINDVMAAGLTPDALRVRIVELAQRFLEEPSATVVVKQINSRKVFITGEIGKPGPYTLTSPMTVLQLIALAGGLREYAHQEQIMIMRVEKGKAFTLPFDYASVAKGKKLQQNVLLKPGDTVVIP